jgi:hypothetical protein
MKTEQLVTDIAVAAIGRKSTNTDAWLKTPMRGRLLACSGESGRHCGVNALFADIW